MPTKRAEKSLRSFLREATIAYAEDAYEEWETEEGNCGTSYTSGLYTVVDIFRVSPDNRVYSGNEVVYAPDDNMWAASYHGAILPRFKPEPILEAYKNALKEPDEDLPIRGPRKIQLGNYEYTLGSTHGPLTVARFAIIEEMTQNHRRVYRGDIAGGWLS